MLGSSAAFLLLLSGEAAASVDDRALLAAWAKARAADTLGAPATAAEGYAAALALSPNNEVLAARALRQAMSAGDMPLAVRSAKILEAKGQLAPDARLLLLADAVRKKNWKAADAYLAQIREDEVFAFTAPVIGAWLAEGSGKGDPLAILQSATADVLAAGYAAEHRPLLLLAAGNRAQGLLELQTVLEGAGNRATRLRLAAAATIARKDRKAALALLDASGEPGAAARKLLEARRPIPGAIDNAAAGIAAFLVRLAIDLQAQQVPEVALNYARLATFLAPDSSETWLVASLLLGAQERPQDAIAVLTNIRPGDPFYAAVADRRIRLLSDSGQGEKALVEARAEAEAQGAGVAAWARLGDVYSAEQRHGDAADAYKKAVQLTKAGGSGQPEWTLWLLLGGALEQADRWPEAKSALEQANKLQPNQPMVLNYLGYAQLERRENVEEAMRLVAEASRLDPDSPEITDSLAWAHFLRGDVATAIPLLEKAVGARPADAEINEHLGDAYYTAGRRFEARYAWEAALLTAKDKDAERLRAKIVTGLTPQLASP